MGFSDPTLQEALSYTRAEILKVSISGLLFAVVNYFRHL
jgi:hypothetical protein